MPLPSRKAVFAVTPVAEMTRSAGSAFPPSSVTVSPSPAGAIAVTRAPVCTRMPFFSHHALMRAEAPSVIMRGTMRSPISTTVSSTPRSASASMMMQPMKPAPI